MLNSEEDSPGRKWNFKPPVFLQFHSAADTIDEKFLDELQREEPYRGLDVRIELQKMRGWCKDNAKQPSRRRFRNWLNKAEENQRGRQGKAKVSSEPIWRQRQAIEQRIRDHPARRDSTLFNPDHTEEQKKELRNLRAKLKKMESEVADG